MDKTLSIIISVDNAVESDLSIPISSINNQLGCDFSQIEVLLIDNGTYKLKQANLLNIFKNMSLKQLRVEQAIAWPDALQLGIDNATGKFVMLMAANGQLNQLSTLQGFFELAKHHPDAEVISGLILNQFFTKELRTEYEVGRDYGTVRGRWIKKSFLQQYGIRFDSKFAPFSEEYVTRLINHFAKADVENDEVVYARFMSRHLDPHVLEPTEEVIDAQWLVMMAAYLEKIRTLDASNLPVMLSRFVIQFFSRTRELPAVTQAGLMQGLLVSVKTQSSAWPGALKAIGALAAQDKTPRAPWNKSQREFANYLQLIESFVTGK